MQNRFKYTKQDNFKTKLHKHIYSQRRFYY